MKEFVDTVFLLSASFPIPFCSCLVHLTFPRSSGSFSSSSSASHSVIFVIIYRRCFRLCHHNVFFLCCVCNISFSKHILILIIFVRDSVYSPPSFQAFHFYRNNLGCVSLFYPRHNNYLL